MPYPISDTTVDTFNSPSETGCQIYPIAEQDDRFAPSSLINIYTIFYKLGNNGVPASINIDNSIGESYISDVVNLVETLHRQQGRLHGSLVYILKSFTLSNVHFYIYVWFFTSSPELSECYNYTVKESLEKSYGTRSNPVVLLCDDPTLCYQLSSV